MAVFGVDASSFQGTVDWVTVDASCAFGVEKTSQGTWYTNPFWAAAKTAMAARAQADGFVPGAYLFLEAGDGAGQADHFAAVAGDLAGFAIAVDVERSKTSPAYADAAACVARLRQHYPGHPITGYIPHWYWGTQDTTFCDVLWASGYVTGSGSPSALYASVPPSFWAAYGGRAPALLQFTSSATVPGVNGPVDCSAYGGTKDQLRALLTGGTMSATGPASWDATDQEAIVRLILRRVLAHAGNNYTTGLPAGEASDVTAAHNGLTALLTAAVPSAVAAAVVAALPPPVTGGLTQADVETAVRSVFSTAFPPSAA